MRSPSLLRPQLPHCRSLGQVAWHQTVRESACFAAFGHIPTLCIFHGSTAHVSQACRKAHQTLSSISLPAGMVRSCKELSLAGCKQQHAWPGRLQFARSSAWVTRALRRLAQIAQDREKIFVGGLPHHCTLDMLTAHFSILTYLIQLFGPAARSRTRKMSQRSPIGDTASLAKHSSVVRKLAPAKPVAGTMQ